MVQKSSPIESYNRLLTKNPLLVKVLTGSVLSGLNEIISSLLTGKIQLSVLSQKTLLMLIYGGCINTPINHFGYKYLIQVVSKLSKFCKLKSKKAINLMQLLGSLFIISPIQVCFLILTLSIVNSPIINSGGSIIALIKNARNNFKQFSSNLKDSVNDKFVKFYTSSFISSTVFVNVAQNFIEPEKWAIFFSCAYTSLNTAQNIYLKLKQAPPLIDSQEDGNGKDKQE